MPWVRSGTYPGLDVPIGGCVYVAAEYTLYFRRYILFPGYLAGLSEVRDIFPLLHFQPDLNCLQVDTSDTAIIRISDLRPMAPDVEGIVENDCINGTFEIWQRGSTQTTSGYRSDDRWANYDSGSTKIHTKRYFNTDEVNGTGNYDRLSSETSSKNYSRTVVSSVAGPGSYIRKDQHLLKLREYSGKRVRVEFLARSDSPKDIAISGSQVFADTGEPDILDISPQKVSLTTSFVNHFVYFDFPEITGKSIADLDYAGVTFWFDVGSNYDGRTDSLGQQSGTFDIADVKIYISDKELPVRRRTDQEELQLCLPYCQPVAATIYPLPGDTTIRHILQPNISMIRPFSLEDIHYQDTAGTNQSGSASIAYATLNGIPHIYFYENSVNNLARNFTALLSAEL